MMQNGPYGPNQHKEREMINESDTQKMAASNPQSAAGGVPLFVDADTDLVAKPGRLPGSWYLSCAFTSRGKTLGFLWHQMFPGHGTETRFLLANCSDGKWFPHVLAEPLGGAVGVSSSRCEVSSSYGTFSGDRSRLVLKVKAGSEAVDVVLVPGPEVLYNGTLGTLPLFGMQSYEYGFPNVVTNGTMTIDGEEFPIDSATAWFDRQFGSLADPSEPAGKGAPIDLDALSWTWLGMTVDPAGRQAISFWDVHQPSGKRSTFLTFLREDGVQMNVEATVAYDRIWTSPESGHRYPGWARIAAPKIGLDVELRALLNRPEFVSEMQSGCQAPCQATGRFGSLAIDKPVIFEMVGNPGG
jgi:hypothetical protein